MQGLKLQVSYASGGKKRTGLGSANLLRLLGFNGRGACEHVGLTAGQMSMWGRKQHVEHLGLMAGQVSMRGVSST